MAVMRIDCEVRSDSVSVVSFFEVVSWARYSSSS